jgi:hypothetical protein
MKVIHLHQIESSNFFQKKKKLKVQGVKLKFKI